MSPSPGGLLFDSNAQYPAAEELTVEMSHFPWSNINAADFSARVRSLQSRYAAKTQG